MGICADRFWLVICSRFIFVAIELHLTFTVRVCCDIRLHRCIRIFDLLLCVSFQTDIVEETHRIRFIDGHVPAFCDLIVPKRNQIRRNLDGNKISFLQRTFSHGLFHRDRDILQISFWIHMIGIRDLRFIGVGYRFLCTCGSFCLLRVIVYLICIDQSIHIIDLHIVTQLIRKSDISTFVRLFSLIHMSRRLGICHDILCNFIKDSV